MTKQIILDNEFTLETDGKQWTLRYKSQRKEETKDGEKVVTTSDEWYCGSICTALKIYTEKALKKCGAGSIEELITKTEKLYSRIEELFSGRYEEEKKVLKGDVLVADFSLAEEKVLAAFEEPDNVQDVLGDMF